MTRPAIKVRCDVDSDSPSTDVHIPASILQYWNPDVRAAADDENTISMFDIIGQGFFTEGVTAKRVDAALRRIGRSNSVVVNINSPGGDMFEGIAIYNLLREHRGTVKVNVLGMAASAASIIAMAGDEIIMNTGSMMMVHNPWVVAAGDYRAFERATEDLRKFTTRGVEIYTARTGLPEKEVRDMLDAETWMGAAEAVDKKFATSSTDVPTKQEKTTKQRARSLEVVMSALRNEGLTRTERREIFQELGFTAPVTGEIDSAAPVTGQNEEFRDLAASLANLKRTIGV